MVLIVKDIPRVSECNCDKLQLNLEASQTSSAT